MPNDTHEGEFAGLGVAPALLQILQKLNFTTPTPIQRQAIPIAIQGTDVMGIAQTGTGKTLAFGLPLIQNVLKGKGRGLVIVPTRELAEQVTESLTNVGRSLGIMTAAVIGGEPIYRQQKRLLQNPQIVIGTPGRLIDHLKRGSLRLDNVRTLILDEADRMLDMGFAPQLREILKSVPKERQTMLFSATMPEEIVAIAKNYMKLPIRVEIAPSGTTVENVTQEVYFIEQQAKRQLLKNILAEYHGSVLVFVRTKFGAKKMASYVRAIGNAASEIHSMRSLPQRREALQGFKTGKYRVLIATDIAARGIDVQNIELVVNYDLPQNAEDYVHRIGRTARAGGSGHAISFAQPQQARDVRNIERLIRATLRVSRSPLSSEIRAPQRAPHRHIAHGRPQGRRFHNRGFRSSGPRRRH